MIQFQDKQTPLDIIDEPAEALRESIDPTSLGDLADDMAINGLLQPIGLRGPSPEGRFEVIWGHRRTLAARMIGWTMIASRVCAWTTAPELARIAENFHRVDLNPREEAHAVAALRQTGKPIAEIARILRRSVGWVQTRVELLDWPEELQDAVARGELTMNNARMLAEVDHTGYRQQLIAEAQRTGASANVVSVWLAHYNADRDRIVRNHDTVAQIMERREQFRVMFHCEVCGEEDDTTHSVLLRICGVCAQTLRERKQNEATARPN